MGRLADRLRVGRPAVSKHLRVLSNAGLIERRTRGTRNLYLLAPAAPEGAALFEDPRFEEHLAFLTPRRPPRR